MLNEKTNHWLDELFRSLGRNVRMAIGVMVVLLILILSIMVFFRANLIAIVSILISSLLIFVFVYIILKVPRIFGGPFGKVLLSILLLLFFGFFIMMMIGIFTKALEGSPFDLFIRQGLGISKNTSNVFEVIDITTETPSAGSGEIQLRIGKQITFTLKNKSSENVSNLDLSYRTSSFTSKQSFKLLGVDCTQNTAEGNTYSLQCRNFSANGTVKISGRLPIGKVDNQTWWNQMDLDPGIVILKYNGVQELLNVK